MLEQFHVKRRGEIYLQDVVFAAGRHECINAKAAQFRSGVTPVSILGPHAVKLEKMDLESLRKGLLAMVQAGAAPELQDSLGEEYAPLRW